VKGMRLAVTLVRYPLNTYDSPGGATPNATLLAPLEAGATQERTL